MTKQAPAVGGKSDSFDWDSTGIQRRGNALFYVENEDEAPEDSELPAYWPIPSKFEVCDRCRGRGVVDHPAFSNGISAADWSEDWDDEDREAYRSGAFDVRCEACEGLRVTLEPDLELCSAELRERIEQQQARDADAASERAFERRMVERGMQW